MKRVRGAMSGSDAIDDGEARLAFGIEIGGAHRIAVHGGIIERRHIDRSDDVLGQYATCRLAQCHGLEAAHRRDAFGNQTLGVGDGQQRAVEGEAIVAELRHYASSRGGPICSSGSASASNTLAIPSKSSSISTGTCACGSGASVATAMIQSSSRCSSGLPTVARKTSSFGCEWRLKPSTITRSTGLSFAK